MPKDFANRSATKPSKRKAAAKRGKKTSSKSPPRRFFHSPSFAGGMIFGALLVLGGAYLPELLPHILANPSTATLVNGAKPDAATPDVQFEFDDMLRNTEVASDSGNYVDAEAQANRTPNEYLLQAASFRSASDADALRARLLLLSLPAATDTVALASGRWYRVTVGPFASRVEAQRAVTELRERDLAPLWIKRQIDPA